MWTAARTRANNRSSAKAVIPANNSPKHSQNKLTDEQYQELEAIISLAREDKWADAEKEAIRLAEVQRP